MKRLAASIAVLVACCVEANSAVAEPVVLKSPDGRIVMTFETVSGEGDAKPAPDGGRLVYSVTFRGKPIVDRSGLRLDLADQPPLGPKVKSVKSAPSKIDETYHLVAGKASTVRDHANAVQLELEETDQPGRKFNIEARAYDDAVAFRYVVPEQTGVQKFNLAKEDTEFRISKDATAYALVLPNFKSQYESEYIKLSLTALRNQGGPNGSPIIGLPLLMEVPGVGWLAINEADVKDYAAMYLVNPAGSSMWSDHWLVSKLAPHQDDEKICVTGDMPHHTPWRVLQIASEPAQLIESNVLTSLNPPAKIEDTSWIHPGKSAWDWWSGSIGADGKPAFTTETMKHFVDFAAKNGLEYMLIDAGWSPREDITQMNGKVDVPAVVEYAKAKNVKVWIWAHYNAVNRQMDEAFPLFEKWGVAGVKIDFVEHDDQQGLEFYFRAAEAAAKHHLMLDFHGCTKPTGIHRTWPNILGYEAVIGMEQSKAGTRDNPEHHVTIPFTRMLAGPMDYTPGGFDNVTRENFEPRMEKPMVVGTRAHQLAMYAVYEAPFQMVSDRPEVYENQPAFDFIKAVPSSWDETRALDGEVGQYITLARRHGDEWYIGSLNGWSPRELEIRLTFLGSGKYTADIYADAADADRNQKHVEITHKTVDHDSSLTAKLAPGGGYAVRLRPVK